MSKIATLKAQAANMRAALEKSGVAISHAQALEAVAAQYGFETWDALAGKLSGKVVTKPPRLSEMPVYPSGVWVEQGLRSLNYVVEYCDMEGLALLDSPDELQEHIEGLKAYAPQYAGMDTPVLQANNADRDLELTFRQLRSAKFEHLGGMAYWKLEDGTYLRFDTGGLWNPKPTVVGGPPELQVPELRKSAKGCRLLVLPSVQGEHYALHVIVPPQLNALKMLEKVQQELKRLKQLDAQLPPEQEYTDQDVKKFVQALGCTFVEDELVLDDTWD